MTVDVVETEGDDPRPTVGILDKAAGLDAVPRHLVLDAAQRGHAAHQDAVASRAADAVVLRRRDELEPHHAGDGTARRRRR